jgi:hypothetical protein
MRTLVVLSLVSSAAVAESHAFAPAAINYAVQKPMEKPRKKGLLHQFFHYIDGGDMHGFGSADGLSRKPENPLHTLTVRWQFHF